MLLMIRCHSLPCELKDFYTAEILITSMEMTQDFKGSVLKLLDIQFQISIPKSQSELLIGLGRKTPNSKLCKIKHTQMSLETTLNPRFQHLLYYLFMEEKRECLVSNQERSLFATSLQILAARSSALHRDHRHLSRRGSSGLIHPNSTFFKLRNARSCYFCGKELLRICDS